LREKDIGLVDYLYNQQHNHRHIYFEKFVQLWRPLCYMMSFDMQSTKNSAVVCLFVVLATVAASAVIIPPDRTVPWVPGITVGLLQPIPDRTKIIDVTRPPYNADKTGHTNCAAVINQAINDAGYWIYGSNTVIYLPAGNYKVTSQIGISKSDITLRGDGIGKTFINGVGNTVVLAIGTAGSTASFNIYSGATKGSTNITVILPPGFTPNAYGWLSVGDIGIISQGPYTVDSPMHVIGSGIGLTGLKALNYVTAINNSNFSLALPLPYDFTNNPTFVQQTFNSQGGLQCATKISLEGISFTMTNPPTGEYGMGPEIVDVENTTNFRMTNCQVTYANQHNSLLGNVVGAYISGCSFDTAQGSGSGHGGMVTSATAALMENNIFANMFTSGIELDGGSGCAFFGNYFTNTGWCIDMHGYHPFMELFEANVSSDTFETDDYFGSCSHFTLWRNQLTGSGFIPIRFNRWSRFMNIVGNVLGQSTTVGGAWQYQMDENSQTYPAIFSFGLPNIGNQFFAGVITNDGAWNYPGTNYFDYAVNQVTIPYAPYAFANKQGPTNVFSGNFAGTAVHPYASVLRLIFQDNANTNVYHTIPVGDGVYPLSITSSNMAINTTFTASNGWTMYVAGAVGYQQIQATDKKTDLITGNYDYFHNAVTWDSNGVQSLSDSMLYPGGPPSWWGTNRWPAVDPVNAPLVTMIPAQRRYLDTRTKSKLSPPSNLRVAP
jgi:hypothetical protein